MTDILVADSEEKLDQLEPVKNLAADTSICSKKVVVQWWVGDDRGRLEDCTTIADGDPDYAPGKGKLCVKKIIIMPIGTEMDKLHPLWGHWVRQIDFLIQVVFPNVAAAPSAPSRKGRAATSKSKPAASSSVKPKGKPARRK